MNRVLVSVRKLSSDITQKRMFTLRILTSVKCALVHANRLKFYADASLDITETPHEMALI